MATLYDKILLANTNITADDFAPDTGTIVLQNDATTPPSGKVAVGTITSENGITQQKLNQHRQKLTECNK